MTAPVIDVAPPQPEQWPGRDLLAGRHATVAGLLRETLHRLVWAPVLALCAGRLRVLGRPTLGPVVYVANHASHADTVAVRAAIGRAGRRRLAVAAADDYFFPTRGRARLFSTMIGAFPFPRHGDMGLRRADALLRAGWSVLLFPQGTRDPRAELRPGVLRLARAGWTVVPVGIAGTDHVLPKGARRPRRHRVCVAFGPPVAPDDLAALATAVQTQRQRAAERAAGAAMPHDQGRAARVSQWLRRRADSRGAPALMFAWAFAEALVWPIIPDASLGILAFARPRRWWLLAATAVAGSVAGGATGWWAATQGWSWPLPLTTPNMHEAVRGWLEHGAAGVAHQPLSGVPYKVFVVAAPDAGIGWLELAGATLRYRGLRLVGTAALAAGAGALLWRRPRRWQEPVHAAVSGAAVVALFAGLAVLLHAWS